MRYCLSVTTKSIVISPPFPDEYAPFYANYVSLAGGGDIVATMEKQLPELTAFFSAREQDAEFRYASGKWSIKEVVGHVIDTERIFAYRALRISRNDKTPIEGFEQDDYMRFSPFDSCRLADLVEEFGHVRRSNLALFRSLDQEAWMRRGTASNKEVTVRALAYMLVGHAAHHRNVLEQKYLPLLA